MKPSALVGFEVERVRVQLETRIRKQLVRRYGDELWASLPSSEVVRREWLAGAVGFSPDLAPRGLRIAGEARRVLGVEQDVNLYRAADEDSRACIAITDGGPLHVRIHDIFLAHPDDAVLLFVMGHELGHHLAHGPHRMRGLDPRVVYRWFAQGRRAGVREVAAAFCRGAELTADRLGLLACQDLDAALRTFLVLASGDPGPTVAGREDEYLAACRERVEHLLARRENGGGDTHPERAVRAFALWAFAETDVYRALTGRGPGGRSLEELDRLLERLAGPLESADDEGLPDIPPPLVERAAESLGAVSRRAHEATQEGLASLRRAGRDMMSGVLQSVGARHHTGDSPGEDEREEAETEVDPDADDLEKRFAELERRALLSTAPQDGSPVPAGGEDLDDLERRFAKLERDLAAGGDVSPAADVTPHPPR